MLYMTTSQAESQGTGPCVIRGTSAHSGVHW